MGKMKKLPPSQARIVEARAGEYLEVAQETLRRFKSQRSSATGEYIAGHIDYWKHVCSALNWIITQERLSFDGEKHGRAKSI